MNQIGQISGFVSLLTITIVLLTWIPDGVDTRPTEQVISREKRGSDQRMAELQTLLSLANMKGKLVSVKLGFGQIDPEKVGRKRRSNLNLNLKKLQHFLETTSDNSKSNDESINEENNFDLHSSWKNQDPRNEDLIFQLI